MPRKEYGSRSIYQELHRMSKEDGLNVEIERLNAPTHGNGQAGSYARSFDAFVALRNTNVVGPSAHLFTSALLGIRFAVAVSLSRMDELRGLRGPQTFIKYEDIAKHASMRSPVACALIGQWCVPRHTHPRGA
jgi:hypothetical protein